MGGGASVLSSEDFVTMSQNLKEEYELLICAGHTDDEIRVKLMEKYNQLFVTTDVIPNGADIVTASAILADGSVPITAAGIEISSAEADKTNISDEKVEIASAVPETTVGLTEKAKKARKRRGTFENDKVVAASKKEPVVAVSTVLVDAVLNQ